MYVPSTDGRVGRQELERDWSERGRGGEEEGSDSGSTRSSRTLVLIHCHVIKRADTGLTRPKKCPTNKDSVFFTLALACC